jgi:hypothetical protein
VAEKFNLAICIPSGRFVDFHFFKSFAKSIPQILMSYNTAILPVSSPYIQENRNEIVRRALLTENKIKDFKFDFFLWLDTDMVFDQSQVGFLLRHLENGLDFVSGLYFNPKGDKLLPVAFRRKGDIYEWLQKDELSGLMEVDAVGFGFCAFKAEIARRLSEKYNNRIFDLRYLPNGGLIGEDQVFCERVKELGFKIWLDSNILIKHAKGLIP